LFSLMRHPVVTEGNSEHGRLRAGVVHFICSRQCLRRPCAPVL
jgi:hypothetical protein